MSQQYDKLKTLLKQLFQLDQPDLDFGLYRIMHAKNAELTKFLDEDLLPQVREALALVEPGERAEKEKELAKLVAGIRAADMDPEESPKIKLLREELAKTTDVTALENEVYEHLYRFFRRYYSDGDFLARTVYKPGVYAIPYEGEEVKFYWANRDQYYIKTSEYLRDYSFRLRPEDEKNPMRVHFRLAEAAEGEHGNVKATEDKDRVFVLAPPGETGRDFISVEDGDLVIRFEYRPATPADWPADVREHKTKPPAQKDLVIFATRSILSVSDASLAEWIAELARLQAGSNNGAAADQSRIAVHLRRYTARNTFDYFIHKNLGRFLRQELDFYIKNEVIRLDDIEGDTAPRVEEYLSKIRLLRRIAGKIIDFLAQLEDFEKKLWLKKKYVVDTQYCITLDRITEEFYAEIAANDAQRQEWVRLFAIDEIQGDLVTPGYSVPLKEGFLTAHKRLIVDTRFFDVKFTERLLDHISDYDAGLDGLLVHSDNFQALRLLEERYRDQVRCIYIDPPYNTASSAIPYKNNYKHSSWATMMNDRVAALRRLLRNDGAIFVSIDKTERTVLEHTMDEVFGQSNHIEELIWAQNTANGQLPNYSTNHEYVEVYARDRYSVERDPDMFREPKPGYAAIIDLVQSLNPTYPPIDEIERAIKRLFVEHLQAYREELEAVGRELNAEAQRQDPWKGIYPYYRAEYRDSQGKLVAADRAKEQKASIWVWSEISAAAPASKQAASTKNPEHYNYRYYRPLHPITKRPCPHPRGGWKFPLNPDPKNPARRSFMEFAQDDRISWGEDETKVPRTKGFLHEVETNIGTSVFYEYNDGESEVGRIFGRSGVFLSPKSSRFVQRFVSQATKKHDYVVDAFGGSGSTAHAVIVQNREDRGRRKYISIEVGNHFDQVMKPRIIKAIYSPDWNEGRPTSTVGQSHCFKYLRLESYEDTLNNLESEPTASQASLLHAAEAQGADGLKEQYILRYMLDVETRSSQSLVNVQAFQDPTAYKLRVKRPGSDESSEVNVDLLETFNWLIGLTVLHIAAPRTLTASFKHLADPDLPADNPRRLMLDGPLVQDPDGPWWFRTVTGTLPDGRRALVIWRKLTGDPERDNLVLNEWFVQQGHCTADPPYQVVWVNGDSNLPSLKTAEDTWQAHLIEDDFHRLMFDVEDL